MYNLGPRFVNVEITGKDNEECHKYTIDYTF